MLNYHGTSGVGAPFLHSVHVMKEKNSSLVAKETASEGEIFSFVPTLTMLVPERQMAVPFFLVPSITVFTQKDSGLLLKGAQVHPQIEETNRAYIFRIARIWSFS